MSINRAIISGNLTADAELRTTTSGTSVASFSIAVNERYKNQQSGQWEDRANFIPVTLFGKRAESLAQYLKKGKKVNVDGRLRWSQWQQDGKNRSKIEVIADDIELLSQSRESKQATQEAAFDFDDDIPF
ncbi:MAG: single-stranded DNA-binding protein [Coriobacteriia bacterium]|nr:single-stranded DNA-binding protein [Coriobacteriia bacterium]